MKKKWVLLTLPFAIFLVALAAIEFIVLPRVTTWAKKELTAYAEKNLPIQADFEDLKLSYFPPALGAKGVVVTSKPELAPVFEKITADHVKVSINIFKLMIGQFEIATLQLIHPEGQITLDSLLEKKSESKELPIKDLFAILQRIPINYYAIYNPNLKILWKKEKLDIGIGGEFLKADFNKNYLNVASDLKLSASYADFHSDALLLLNAKLTTERLQLLNLDLTMDGAQIKAKGIVNKISEVLINPIAEVQSQLSVDLGKLQVLLPKKLEKIKPLHGEIVVTVQGSLMGLEQNHLSIAGQGSKMSIADMSLGDAKIEGILKNNTLEVSELSVKHMAGEADLAKIKIDLNKPYRFSTNINLKSFDAVQLFKFLKLENVPVNILAHAKGDCAGQLLDLNVNCQASISATDIRVATGTAAKDLEIIAIEKLFAKGKFNINLQKFNFESQLSFDEIPKDTADMSLENQGQAQGEVDFKTGFKIGFSTGFLNFNRIKNLANLNMKGLVKLDGFTQGDSNAALFKSKTQTQQFEIDGYYLDQLLAQLSYEKGFLKFEETTGRIIDSPLAGNITFDFNKSRMNGVVTSPNMDIPAVLRTVESKIQLPFYVSGKGPVTVEFEGPISFWDLNMKIQSHFIQGLVAKESFDRLQANLELKDRKLQFIDVYLLKNKARLNLTGHIEGPQGKLALKSQAFNIRLEESETISEFNNSLSGLLSLNADIEGTIERPEVFVKSSLSDVTLNETSLPSSSTELSISRDRIQGKGNVLGNKIQVDFSIPFKEGREPLYIKSKTQDWSFTSLLALTGAQNLKNQYETSLTSHIDLKSESGSFNKVHGFIKIDEFLLRRGSAFLKNPKPIVAEFNDGVGSLENFYLTGEGGSVRVDSSSFSKNRLNFNVKVKSSLSLLHAFLPFLEELGGEIDLATTIIGPASKPEILGSAKLSEVFIKIPGFPHPIERLNGEATFSHSKVIINQLKGYLSGGSLRVQGTLNLKGLKDIPADISIVAQGVNLNVPEHFKTAGNLQLKLTGNWFPFLLSGRYDVSSALIDKEFTGGEAAGADLKQSYYLPKVVKEGVFEPILLDLQIYITKNAYIKNSLVDGSLSGNLNVRGTPSSPVILGNISLNKGSKLLFRDKAFDVQIGLVNFTDPNELNPEFYVSATSRVAEYDINLLVQGTPKNISVKTSSSPPLPEQDILTLLALGMTSETLDKSVSAGSQRRQTEFEVGSALISQTGLDKKVKENTGFDVQLGTYFDTTKNVSVPRVTISRQIKKKVNASYSRTLGDQTQSEARLQYRINSNVSAIGSWQSQEAQEGASTTANDKEKQILGIDLEYKREFK